MPIEATPLYIFDIDGTLADGTHRLPYITEQSPKDWDTYFSLCADDAPITEVINTMHDLHWAGAEIRFFSGRSDAVRQQTIAWLVQHTVFEHHELDEVRLRMRPAGDHCDDDHLKRRFLEELHPADRARLRAVFDDRDRVVSMWREAGVRCYQVAPGAF